MTTLAINPIDIDVERDEVETRALTSVANPRRTIWTGYAKDALDRLPAS